jgi:3-hydroxyisobutyrate dehydrogenase-like beta-hydroxyacid dehydrogenase
MRVAILGMGEAGRLFARDLVAKGSEVAGYDVRDVERMPGVDYAPSIAAAVTGADLVISLTTAAGSIGAATEAKGHLNADTVYADLNAASPARKIAVSEILAGVAFADVAVLAPVARDGLRTPVMVSGSGAARYVELVSPFGGPITTVSDIVGDASGRKLIRSIFMKSLATSVLESLAAARIAGCEEWARGQIVGELGSTGDALVERLVTGTRQHAERRLHEMEDTKSYLDELGSFSDMTEASIAWLAGVSAGDRS